MASVKVLTDFSKLRDDDLYIFAYSVIQKMTGNANYPSPVPTLEEVGTAAIAFKKACVEKLSGGKEHTANKKERRRELESLLQALAWHVQSHCRNNLPILLTSGFNSRKARTPGPEPGKPSGFKVEDGPNPGSIRLRVAKLNGAASYIFEYAAAPVNETTQWVTRIGKARVCLVEGLTSGQRYAFRVAGVGSSWSKIYSDVINRYAQ